MQKKTIMEVVNQIKLKQSNSLINKILGRDKFIMLNMVMLKKLGPNASCFLTFLLDRADFLEKSKQIISIEDDGMFIYRADVTDKLGLTAYQQRNIERELQKLDLINVIEERLDDNQTRNRYFINLIELDEFLDTK